MKRIFIMLICMQLCLVGFSQIASAEYFFDTDPGLGNGTTLSITGTIIDENVSIPTTSLSEGVHKLYVRVLNTDGTWSLYGENVVYVSADNVNSASITSAEYFFDTDPGFGNGTVLSVSGNIIDDNSSIPTTGLSEGVHKLYIRVLNTNSTWSLYDKNVVYVSADNVNSASITSAEYFYDIDPGLGNGTALSISGAIIDENFSIPTTGLSEGVHKLYIRVLNADGTWSLYDKNIVYVSVNNSNDDLIVEAEYFIDIDPGVGNATAIDLSDGVLVDEDLNLDVPSDLEAGDHIVYIRVLNENGIWSLYARSDVSTLSINAFNLNAFKLYPNPVENVLYIDTNNQEMTDFKIVDLTGKVIYNAIPNHNQLNTDWLSSGAYLVQIKTEKGSLSKKLIKK